MDDIAKVQLDTLRLGSTTLIWWESWTQAYLIQHGKIISSWIEFITALRKQFYPFVNMKTRMID